MITHQTQVMRYTAGENVQEGVFVKLGAENKVVVASKDTTAEEILGVVTDYDAANKLVDVALPGFAGIVGVRVAGAIEINKHLCVTDGGKVTTPSDTSAPVVAVLVRPATAADTLIEARLLEPYNFTPSEAARSDGNIKIKKPTK